MENVPHQEISLGALASKLSVTPGQDHRITKKVIFPACRVEIPPLAFGHRDLTNFRIREHPFPHAWAERSVELPPGGNPDSPVVPLLAKFLDIEPQRLRAEICDTLLQLWQCRMRLSTDRQKQFCMLIHDTLPIGRSAILLDASPKTGRVQVETKLYRAPRIDSFGFEVTAPSDFYLRNYQIWHRVFDDSIEYVPGRLVTSELPLLTKL